MGPKVNALSARRVQTLDRTGRHADGGGLYLNVSDGGTKSWLFMWKVAGRRREMGLGPLRDVSLGKARELAAAARQLVRDGKDPIAAREQRKAMSFGEAADALVASMSPTWRNEKHRAQWSMTLTAYCQPIRSRPVADVGTEDVLRVLRPLWLEKPETASRLRGRMEKVLDYAKARGLRSGENPARWRGHLDAILPAAQKLTRGHHKAMRYEEVPAFLARLRDVQGTTARALEFCILCAARSGEVLGARWGEFDLDKKVWTVPANRMKAGREHRVPLSGPALAILQTMWAAAALGLPEGADAPRDAYVFPGAKAGRPLSVMAFDMCLRRLKLDVTTHGFRSSFRDWAGDNTTHAREVAEAALAHVVGDKAEQAYRRGDALEKRRSLMEAWASYIDGQAASRNVVALSAARG